MYGTTRKKSIGVDYYLWTNCSYQLVTGQVPKPHLLVLAWQQNAVRSVRWSGVGAS
ncbi:MAG TPA: hypothetical protein VF952_09025 [Chloroflexia bacterium]